MLSAGCPVPCTGKIPYSQLLKIASLRMHDVMCMHRLGSSGLVDAENLILPELPKKWCKFRF